MSWIVLSTCRCNVNAANSLNQTSAMLASMNGHAEALLSLVTLSKCDIERLDCSNMNALHYAAKAGHANILQVLYEHGADLHVKTGDGVEPAMLAAMNGNNSALGWFESAGRIRLKESHYKALALSTIRSQRVVPK